MKKFKEFKQPKGTGGETSWKKQGVEINLKDLLGFTSKEIKNIKTSDLKPLLIEAERDPERVDNANLDYPIIIGSYKGEYVKIIDGHHRLAKALKLGEETIKSRILNFDQSPEYLKNLFGVRESMVHQNSLSQLNNVSSQMDKIDIGSRVSDDSFANAVNTKKNITNSHIQTYQEFMNEPFEVNQNRKPWEERNLNK